MTTRALTYRLVQFCPSVVDEIRVNIGVAIADGTTRHVSMLSARDLEARCKALSGSSPDRSNAVVQDLQGYSRMLARHGSPDGFDFTEACKVPAILAMPERYNNQIRLSPEREVVYGDLRSTADFLMKNLVPVAENEPRRQVSTRIRSAITEAVSFRPALHAAMVDRPDVDLARQSATFDFGFSGDGVRALTRVLNFNQANLRDLRDRVNSTNFVFDRIRQLGATLRTGQDTHLAVPRDVALDVVFHRPDRPDHQDLLQQMQAEWNDLDVRSYADTDIESFANDLEAVLV